MNLLNPAFRYTPSYATDVRETFRRAREAAALTNAEWVPHNGGECPVIGSPTWIRVRFRTGAETVVHSGDLIWRWSDSAHGAHGTDITAWKYA